MIDVPITDNVARVQEAIADACARANRDPATVTLVAVSKQKPVADILAALEAGLHHFGENRVGEAENKIPVVNTQAATRPIWHMIGHIQSRKAKAVVPLFDVIHAVDRAKIAHKLSQLALDAKRKLPIMLEVNISGETAKYGFDVAGWQHDSAIKAAFWETVSTIQQLPGLEIRGLMTLAPYVDNMEQTRPVFADMAQLQQALRDDFELGLPDLSMGMTNDFPVAIEEGATIVRIGRAIFGSRK